MNAFPDFTLDVAGEGVTIDPATGLLTIATDALRAGHGVVLTARDASGATTGVFQITITLSDTSGGPGLEIAVAPSLVSAPRLEGAGLVGQEITLDTGRWSGTPAPELGIEWLRDGVGITGATGATYRLAAEDDGAVLSARVTARNTAGATSAVTGILNVTRIAPSATGTQADVVLTQGSGVTRLGMAALFAGEALGFSVSGAGVGAQVVINPATGALDLSTDTLRAPATITVTATNSGGAAALSFKTSVIAAPVKITPPARVGTVPDVTYALGSGARSVSTQAHFSGEDLIYALEGAPAGVTIQPGSGLVVIATATALDAALTVRATNAGGTATQSFRVVVRSMATIFSTAESLAELGFLTTGAAPAFTFDAQGFARLIPATTGRTHGNWRKAGGDGTYRCLARWSANNSTAGGNEPFALGARLAKSGANLSGLYVEAYLPASGAGKRLRILQYTGVGEAVTELATALANWIWSSWNWLEVEVAGSRVRARIYADGAPVPDWQISAITTVPAGSGPGGGLGFGPGGFPLAGVSPTLLLKRIEFAPLEAEIPAAAASGAWSLAQVTE